MTTVAHQGGNSPQKHRLDIGQLVKWTIYVLLLINFLYYFLEEIEIASHTLRNGGSFLDWTREFATSIDELGWFGLLFMFELETYALSDEAMENKSVRWAVHGFRLIFYVLLAHTVLARVTTIVDFRQVVEATEVTNLCQLTEQKISFGENLHYTIIDQANCAGLSRGNTFYYLDPSVITDSDGYRMERKHIWVDMIDAVVWLLVVWAIELAVWLQNRDISHGRLMLITHTAKIFYAVLFIHAGFWAYAGHWVYAWDQFLWIAGFWVIEMNLSEWRDDIREEQQLNN